MVFTDDVVLGRRRDAVLYCQPDPSAAEAAKSEELLGMLSAGGYDAESCEMSDEEVMAGAKSHVLYITGQRHPVRGYDNIKAFLASIGRKKTVLPALPQPSLKGYAIVLTLRDPSGSCREAGTVAL